MIEKIEIEQIDIKQKKIKRMEIKLNWDKTVRKSSVGNRRDEDDTDRDQKD